MCYTEFECTVFPAESYKILRGCPNCGKRTPFINTKKFRVNANGNRLDVRLIYQCEYCRHTCNLAIYKRVPASSLCPGEYKKFLDNDPETALRIGTDREFFRKNRAELLPAENTFTVQPPKIREYTLPCKILIHNPFRLKLRSDRILSALLGISRNKIKELQKIDAVFFSASFLQKETVFILTDRFLSFF